MDNAEPKPRSYRRLRKVLAIVVVVVVLVVVGVAMLPWALGTAPVRGRLVATLNAKLAPARLELGGARLAWFRPIRLSGLAVIDAKGRRLLTVEQADLDRGLLGLLIKMPNYGTITLHKADLDVERRADGTIDLVESLGPLIDPKDDENKPSDPRTSATLVVIDGTLRLRSPELAEPLVAESLAATVRAPAVPDPLSVAIQLGRPTGERLDLKGTYDHHAPSGAPMDLTLDLTGSRWPLAVAMAGVEARGRFDGKAGIRIDKAGLSASGEAQMLDLDASGPTLAGDRLRLDQIGGTWDVAQGAQGWTIRDLDIQSRLGTIAGKGDAQLAAGPMHLEGRLDLAALARELPDLLHIRDGLVVERGEARFDVDLAPATGGQRLTARARVADLLASDAGHTVKLAEPATLDVDLTRSGQDIRVDRLELRAASQVATGSGDLASGIKLQATIDLAALQAQLRDLIDFGAIEMAGQGRLAAEYRREGSTFDARLGSEFRGLRVAGLTSEPIARDALTLHGEAKGPADASGLPTSWQAARVRVQAGDLVADVSASDPSGTLTLNAMASGPLEVSGRAGQADLKVAARRADRAWDLDDVRLRLQPADPALNGAGAMSIAARGRYDEATGTLALSPIEGVAPAPIGLTKEGLRIANLTGSGGPIRAEGGLIADLGGLDRSLATWLGSAQGLEGWTAVTLDASYDKAADRLAIQTLNANGSYGDLGLAGTLDDPAGRRVADLQGTLTPNWEKIDAYLAGAVQPGTRVRAGFRPFHVKGPLSGESKAAILRGLDAELALDLTEAEALGVVVGPTPIVFRCAGGQATIDPIRTTVNNGQADIRPELAIDDPAGLTLRLANGTGIQGAEINEQVSHDLLVLIAPILDRATQVRGHVSVAIQKAEVPLEGEGRKMNLRGQLAFQDVVYGPGPFAAELFTLIGRGQPPALRLDETLELAVVDGRVHQRGLAFPIGPDAKIELDGSVGFDRTLALRAAVPITGSMLGNQAALKDLVGGTQVAVPIGGTLTHPTLDRQALAMGVRDLGKTLIKRGAAREANDLLHKIGAPEGLLGPAAEGAASQAGQAPGNNRIDPLKLLDQFGRGRTESAPGIRRQ